MGTVRFLLALCVVVTHSPGAQLLGFSILSGITAVQAFYVISGFLITMILNERNAYRSLKNFYLSRYLRLWPPYVAVALLTLFLTSKWQLETGPLQAMAGVTQAFVWFSNLSLLFQDWFCFLQVDNGYLSWTAHFGDAVPPRIVEYLLVPQCWTIGVEMTFYLLAPFVCRRWWGALSLLLFGLAIRVIIARWQQPALDPWLYRFAPSEMMMFGSGALSYFIGRLILTKLAVPVARAIGIACLTTLSIVILANSYVQVPINQLFGGWYWNSLYLTNGPILILVAISCPFLFKMSCQNRVDDLLGELSYPIYLTHLAILDVAFSRLPAAWLAGNLLGVLLIVAASYLLFVGVVVPVDRLRQRFGARMPVNTLVEGEAEGHVVAERA